MRYETANWPYLEARDHGPKRDGPVKLVVVHTPEAIESDKTAENIARYFQNPDYPSSAHITADSNSVVQSVKDSYVAYGAPGANHNGLHIELAGSWSQKRKDWFDYYSIATLAIGADAVSQWCLKYDLPRLHLSDAELAAGHKGIVGHDQVSRVFKRSDHTDPGPDFPWKLFIRLVEAFYAERTAGV